MRYKIREFREEKGWSQEKLSEESNVSRTIISRLENGTMTITTTETLIKVAKALGKKVSDIFLDQPSNKLNIWTERRGNGERNQEKSIFAG